MIHGGEALAQTRVDDMSNEIPAFAPLLDGIDLEGSVITADAPHTQHNHASYLNKRGTSPLPAAEAAGTTSGRSLLSAWPDELGHKITSQRP